MAFELDPRTFAAEAAPALAAMGATRARLGVQEFDPKVQAAINRIQPYDVVRATVERLRAVGIGSINFDLMYGLPFQTEETLARTVAQTAGLRPDRVALFGYAHVPWMAKNQRMVPRPPCPLPPSASPRPRRRPASWSPTAMSASGSIISPCPDDAMAERRRVPARSPAISRATRSTVPMR